MPRPWLPRDCYRDDGTPKRIFVTKQYAEWYAEDRRIPGQRAYLCALGHWHLGKM